jgi:hypothetical protein
MINIKQLIEEIKGTDKVIYFDALHCDASNKIYSMTGYVGWDNDYADYELNDGIYTVCTYFDAWSNGGQSLTDKVIAGNQVTDNGGKVIYVMPLARQARPLETHPIDNIQVTDMRIVNTPEVIGLSDEASGNSLFTSFIRQELAKI